MESLLDGSTEDLRRYEKQISVFQERSIEIIQSKERKENKIEEQWTETQRPGEQCQAYQPTYNGSPGGVEKEKGGTVFFEK